MKTYFKATLGQAAVTDRYDAGLSFIRQGEYTRALSSLLKIENSAQAPPDTVLYILWARLKLLHSSNESKAKKREELKAIASILDSCAISLRSAPLFWYVRGLFFSQSGRWEMAMAMLEKSLRARPDFKPAREEWRLIRQKQKDSLTFIRPVQEWFRRSG